MRVITTDKWGAERTKPRGKELLARIVENSRCVVAPAILKDQLEAIHIEFHGELASIPNIKQSKIPGTNYTNPDILMRVKAMDVLYNRETAKMPPLSFGTEEVGVLLICGDRKRSFDTDNCMATIKDWLEPRTKQVGRKKHSRGWGIGLIHNDSQANGFPFHSKQTGVIHDHTVIIVRRMESLREYAFNFISGFYLGGLS